MASRLGRRIFAQAVRPSLRTTGRTAGRRCMSSSAEAGKSSDMPWIIGSAITFGPLAIWLISSGSTKKSHDVALSHSNDGAYSVKNEDESAPEPSGEEAEDKPESSESKDAITDSDGETVSGKEVNESMQQSFNEDSPPDAQAAEEKKAKDGKWAEGAPGQTSEAETKPEQKEKPTEKKGGEAPSDLGDARKTSKGGEAPKESGASK
ncbi:uncharacterized protein C8Q71DRAFT_738796 [Rhodofomes roseus]|uniref:Uncharacterized protein n=1 Tax=Rhodofomes roseus TaxID=34475 RepID=A0A4Y9YJ09_9APHY|nr:uncharacterized protein C8Q71DRAFT_738796 [Rhodofomes roseus]KAH9841782.1 hypothetical protein C8Q71DRAFT_738796 [Rhodofomes roseus]TFY62516.1 hypothetical protein EVJ58_g3820 [Rhodofomes roseus]